MKLLLIDDNVHLADRICRHLRKKFTIECTTTGVQGIEKALEIEYALILLDLHLPDIEGIDICRQLRAKGIATPILVISANNSVENKIDLLNCGADDYIVKPFSTDELVARIEAILRRDVRTYARNILKAGDLVIDTTGRTVSRAGKKIELRRKEFDILEYLVRNQGRAVTRDMILSHVWEDGKNSWRSTVDVHVKYLRDKVDRPFGTPLIKTAYGIGYMVDNSS